MGSLYLLDKNWMLTELHSCKGAEKLSKRQREELSHFGMIHGDLTLSWPLYTPYLWQSKIWWLSISQKLVSWGKGSS